MKSRGWALGALLAVSVASPALATEIHRDVDQVNRVTTYTALVIAQGFKAIINEPWLSLTCTPTGSVFLKWHEGGAIDGSYEVGPIGVSYRFDDLPVVKTTFENIEGDAGIRAFYAGLISHKKLMLISEFSTRSETLNISDFGAKAGPKSALGRQCYSALSLNAPAQPTTLPPVNLPTTAGPVGIMRTHTLPPYPPISVRLGEEGITEMRVVVAATGDVESVVVEKTSGSQRLDQAAADFVKAHWKYSPVQGVVSATIPWRLMDAK